MSSVLKRRPLIDSLLRPRIRLRRKGWMARGGFVGMQGAGQRKGSDTPTDNLCAFDLKHSVTLLVKFRHCSTSLSLSLVYTRFLY